MNFCAYVVFAHFQCKIHAAIDMIVIFSRKRSCCLSNENGNPCHPNWVLVCAYMNFKHSIFRSLCSAYLIKWVRSGLMRLNIKRLCARTNSIVISITFCISYATAAQINFSKSQCRKMFCGCGRCHTIHATPSTSLQNTQKCLKCFAYQNE